MGSLNFSSQPAEKTKINIWLELKSETRIPQISKKEAKVIVGKRIKQKYVKVRKLYYLMISIRPTITKKHAKYKNNMIIN